MAGGQGVNGKLGLKKASVWGTFVAPTTNDRVPFTGSTLQKAIEKIPDDSLLGKSTRAIPANGSESVPGQLTWLGDYRQVPHLLVAACLAGAAGAPTLVETGVYLHKFPWQASTDGLFLSAGVDLAGKDVHGFASIKPTQRSIEIRGGGRWEESFQFLGAVIDKTIASSGWTFRYDPNGNGARRILASQTVCRVNTHAGGALGAGDVVKPNRIGLTFARALSQDFPVGQVYGEEPILGDFAEITVVLDFFGMTAELLALFLDNKQSDTPLKMDLVATHGTLLGATKFRHRAFYFPKLSVVDCPTEIEGPGPVPMRVTLTAHASDVVPTGFPTGYDEEVTEEAQFEFATDVLA